MATHTIGGRGHFFGFEAREIFSAPSLARSFWRSYGGRGCGFSSWIPLPGRRVRRDLVELSFLPFLRLFFAAFFLVFFTCGASRF